MRRARLRLAAIALALGACSVPSLQAINEERPRGCDEAHPCGEGFACDEGHCRAKCEPGTREECGLDVGECRKGVRTCGDEGRFGPCEGGVAPVAELCNEKDDDCDGQVDDPPFTGVRCPLSAGICAGASLACGGGQLQCVYGPEFEAAESRCDGLDNDCDGLTDEELTFACEKQQGVCAGASKPCAPYPPTCSAEDYRSRSGDYQPFEESCDGKDNDCDGQVDSWSPVTLSAGTARSAVAVSWPQSNGAERLIVLHEEGLRIVSRWFQLDGSSGTPAAPSTSVAAAERAFAPAIATDGITVVAAWIEEVGGVRRVMFAPLSEEGLSTVNGPCAGGCGAVSALASDAAVAVAIAVEAQQVFLAIEEQPAGASGMVKVARFSAAPPYTRAFPFLQVTKPGVAGRRPHLAGALASRFHVVVETDEGVELTTVDALGAVARSEAFALPGASHPHVFDNLAAGPGSLVTVHFTDGLGQSRILTRQCNSSSCSAAPDFAATTGAIRNLRVVAPERGQKPTLAVWEESIDAAGQQWNAVRSAYASLTSVSPTDVTAPGAHGYRPSGVLFPTQLVVLFDDSTTDLGGTVFVRPFCIAP